MCIRTSARLLVRVALTSASDLAAKLLTEAHVVTVPGEPFGTDEHIRLSYAVSADVIDKGGAVGSEAGLGRKNVAGLSGEALVMAKDNGALAGVPSLLR